jgi:hypothetical protein
MWALANRGIMGWEKVIVVMFSFLPFLLEAFFKCDSYARRLYHR